MRCMMITMKKKVKDQTVPMMVSYAQASPKWLSRGLNIPAGGHVKNMRRSS